MNQLKFQYYKVAFISIKRSALNGSYNNAKPILLLSILDEIENGSIKDNVIYYSQELQETYNKNANKYSKTNSTPLLYPYYYLHSDDFYHLEGTQKELKLVKTPSAKYLQENVKYARLDNALWDLLQDSESRQALREVIIKHFLT